jgi:hypothetical protein
MKNIWFILLLVVVQSCSEMIAVNKTLPAEMVINNSESMLIINQFDYQKLEFNTGEDKKRNIYKSGIDKLFESLDREFAQRNGADITFFSELIVSDSIDTKQVEGMCADEKIDFILALKSYEPKMHQTNVERNEDNDKIAFYDLVVIGRFSLYGCENYGLLNSWKLEARRFYESRSVESGLLAFGPSLKRAGDKVDSVSDDLGKIFVDRFHPRNIHLELYYYNTKAMKEAVKYIKAENYDAVIELLLPLSTSSNLVTAGEAANNLYVVYEILGNAFESDRWYRKASEANQLHSSNVKKN